MGAKGKTEPRFFPPPLRELTSETSAGFEVIEFAKLLGIELYPFQKWALIHGLELLEDGSFRWRVVVIEVARQNGKTMLMVVLGLWRIFQYGASRVLSAAQSLSDAEDTLNEAFLIAAWNPVLRTFLPDNPRSEGEDDKFNGAWRPRANGKASMKLASAPVPEILDVAKTMPIWSLAVTSRKGGRSKSVDLALLDELREHLGWEAWNAIVPTSRNRPQSQVWGFSNAGDQSSVVLRSLRESAIRQIDDGNTTTKTAFFSWSADPEASILDPEAHAQANPSMGYSNITAESIMAEAEDALSGDNEAGFRAEALCQWQQVITPGKIPTKIWESLTDPESHRATDAPVHIGIDVASDGRFSHIAIASQREDGLWHIEIIASRAGFKWVPEWLGRRKAEAWFPGKVGMQIKGSASASLAPLVEEAGIEVIPWQGTSMSASVLGFIDEIRNRGLRHRSQPILNVSIEGAIDRRLGDISIWDRVKSATDVSPTVAANIAWWMATRPDDDQFVSAYADEGYDTAIDYDGDDYDDDDYLLIV